MAEREELTPAERERLLARLDERFNRAYKLLLEAVGETEAPRCAWGVPDRSTLEMLRWFLYAEEGRLLLRVYTACGLVGEAPTAIVLSPEFAPLFTAEELKRARRDLDSIVLRPLVRQVILEKVRAKKAARCKGVGRSRVTPSVTADRDGRRRRRGG